MTVSLEHCQSVYDGLLEKWDEVKSKQDEYINSISKDMLNKDQTISKSRKRKYVKIIESMALHAKQSQKGNVYSIITGIAIMGLGITVGWACPPAGAIVAGLGASLITHAVADEISNACEPIKKEKKLPDEAKKYPPAQIEFDESEYGVHI